jgi:endonuclease/exonuclease/phosphatase family metal-dependent hydrolase
MNPYSHHKDDLMLQVITANIGGHRSLHTSRLNPVHIAHQIRQNLIMDPTLPSLIAFQEVVQIRFEDGELHDLAMLVAQELGADYRSYFAPKISTLKHPDVWVWDVPAYQGATFVTEGNAIVTNLPLGQWAWGASVPVHVSIGYPRLYSTGNRDTEPRNLIAVPVLTEYGTVYFMGTHLSTLRGEDRNDIQHPITQQAQHYRALEVDHILKVLEEIRASEVQAGIAPRPCILAGDFNANENRDEIQHLMSQFTHHQPTSPHYTHINHQIDIDHVFISDPQGMMPPPKSVQVVTQQPIPKISDHLLKIALF